MSAWIDNIGPDGVLLPQMLRQFPMNRIAQNQLRG